MSTYQHKKAVADEFFKQIQTLNFGKGRLVLKKPFVEILYPDQTLASIDYAERSKGLSKGEFGADMRLIISNKSLTAALLRVGLGFEQGFSDHLFSDWSIYLVPKRLNGYKFTEGVKIDSLVKRMVGDIDRYFIPIINKYIKKIAQAGQWLDEYKKPPLPEALIEKIRDSMEGFQ